VKNELGHNHLGFRRDLGRRIEEAAGKFETKTAAAKAAGVTLMQFNKWIAGTVKVPMDGLYALATAARIDFSWLATGNGNMHGGGGSSPEVLAAAVDEDLMGRIVDGIMAVYKDLGMRLPPRSLGELAARVAADLVAAYDDPADRVVGLKGALQRLRTDVLRSSDVGTGDPGSKGKLSA